MTSNQILSPAPAGARKSIFHPNETDIKVFDAILSFDFTADSEGNTPRLQMDWIASESGIEKSDVQKSIKWLQGSDYITTHSRGRGTHYTPKVTENNLEVVDPSTVGTNFRTTGGPTVKEIVKAIFNGLEPLERVSPKQITKMANAFFPEKNLVRESFGQVFTKMAESGDLFCEGEARSRKYWRGMNKIEGAAEISENISFESVYNSIIAKNDESSETTSEDTSSEEINNTTESETSEETFENQDNTISIAS